jgi:biopolymer transport protein ExbD
MKFQREQHLLTMFSFSSLTDIVMLLLIFFLLSSSFVSQQGLKVQLPRAVAAVSQDQRGVTLTLTRTGEVLVNSRPASRPLLVQTIAAALGENKDQVVVINADREVSLQSTVEVIDAAKGAGASRFLIATEPPKER